MRFSNNWQWNLNLKDLIWECQAPGRYLPWNHENVFSKQRGRSALNIWWEPVHRNCSRCSDKFSIDSFLVVIDAMCLYGIVCGTIIHCSKEIHSFSAHQTSSNLIPQCCRRKFGLAEASFEVLCVFGGLNTRFILSGRCSHSVLMHKTSQGLELNTNQSNTCISSWCLLYTVLS